jgi:hypothetical protein
MSIFGKLDAAAVSTNPFHIDPGEYFAEVTKAEYKNKEDGTRQLVLEFTVSDEDSPFNKYKASQVFNLVDAELTAEMFELLPPAEKQDIRRTMASMKKTLCGADGNSRQKGLGVPVEDLNDENWDPAVVIGTKISMGISNGGSNNEYVNVRWVNIIEA